MNRYRLLAILSSKLVRVLELKLQDQMLDNDSYLLKGMFKMLKAKQCS